MTIIDKLVYLINQGVITIDNVAEKYKVEVEKLLK